MGEKGIVPIVPSPEPLPSVDPMTSTHSRLQEQIGAREMSMLLTPGPHTDDKNEAILLQVLYTTLYNQASDI